MEAKPQLGSWYTIRAYAVKTREIVNADETPPEKPIRWEYYPVRDRAKGGAIWTLWQREEVTEPTRGMFIGWRTVSDGITSKVGHEYTGDAARVYSAKRYHRIWLFVVNERENPIFVLPEDVTLED